MNRNPDVIRVLPGANGDTCCWLTHLDGIIQKRYESLLELGHIDFNAHVNGLNQFDLDLAMVNLLFDGIDGDLNHRP